MSTTPPEPPPRTSEPPPAPEFDIPNAEKYMLEADVMRRRQLRSALLHGSTRTWREHRKVWPGVVAGIVAGGLIIAVIAVKTAYDKDKESQDAAALLEFCDSYLQNQTVLLGEDLDLTAPDEVESAAGTARDLSELVPEHVAGEVGPAVETIADQYGAMVDHEDDPDRLAELNTANRIERARADLESFSNDNCDDV
ncbi:MAG TPA: hypothetical protein VKB55_13075 [Nocardioidaceae bacterium]|nr:hypothetical protein [Nocardioidaceae bacterium]